MSLSDLISELRSLEDAERFQGPKVMTRLAKLLSELEICDAWLYHEGCSSPGGKRRAGIEILQGLLQDALQELGLEGGGMQSTFKGDPGTSPETPCQKALECEDIPYSAEALLAAYIQALKAALETRPGTESSSSTNNTRRHNIES